MSQITKIEVQTKDKTRANLYVDEEFFCGISVELVVKLGLKKGMEIEMSYLEEIVLEDEKSKAMNKAVKYISSSLKTTKQIADYLKKKEYGESTISYVVEKLIEYKYVDDEAYVKAYVSTFSNKYGKNKLKVSLKGKGINEEIIDKVIDGGEELKDSLRDVGDKYMRNKQPTREVLAKLGRFLFSRGYSWDDIKVYIDDLKNQEDIFEDD